METKSIFKTLSEINCNDKTEKKNGLTYLSWSWAWGIVKQHYPSANYNVHHFDGKPYLFDANLGYMVMTTVTIDGESIPMQLPVMDGANKAQKNVSYTYGKYEKTCEAATMFDINTAIMRCLTKNLAMFGLGHYIYAGEDLPEESSEQKEAKKEEEKAKTDSLKKQWADDLNGCKTHIQYTTIWKKYPSLQSDAEFFDLAKVTGTRVLALDKLSECVTLSEFETLYASLSKLHTQELFVQYANEIKATKR